MKTFFAKPLIFVAIILLHAQAVWGQYYIVGNFNNWDISTGEPIFAVGTLTIINVDLASNPEALDFKLVEYDYDYGRWVWYGGLDESQVGYFQITDDMLGGGNSIPIYGDKYDNNGNVISGSGGVNFRLPSTGSYKISVGGSPDVYGKQLFIDRINDLVGDVNHDGKVNVSDIATLVNMILGTDIVNNITADVNSDGKVNVSDVTALINIILGIKN